MARRTHSVFILIPGPWDQAADVVAALGRHGIESSPRTGAMLEPGQIAAEVISDPDLVSGFSWGRGGPLPDELLRKVGLCRRAALLEIACRIDREPRLMARIGQAMRAEGGVAVRMEASGAASAWQEWFDHFESAETANIYDSVVMIVRSEDGTYFTCGMHQFDLPDAQIALDDGAAIDWLETFNVFQLVESPVLGSGHTFSPGPEASKRTLEHWPDHRHHPNDGRHNPFGVWRLLPPHEARIQPTKLVPMIIPSLVAMLLNKERQLGRALEPQEVSKLVEQSPCIAMERAHALELEKSRGYADIEPALAWEQWQLIRDTF